MALKGKVADLSEVPEAARSFYVERDGAFFLDVADMAPKDKLGEFRANNIALAKQVEDLKAKYEGVDPEDYANLKSAAAKAKEKDLMSKDKWEEVFTERVAPMKSNYEKLIKERDDKLAARESKLSQLMIDNQVRADAIKAGARPTAVDDLILRAHTLFKFDGEKAVAKNGDEPVFGANGEPLAIGEWIGSLAEKAPHLFESSQGGGAPKQGQSSTHLGANRVSRNDTKAFMANAAGIANGTVQVVD